MFTLDQKVILIPPKNDDYAQVIAKKLGTDWVITSRPRKYSGDDFERVLARSVLTDDVLNLPVTYLTT
jgi:hypothetical protein